MSPSVTTASEQCWVLFPAPPGGLEVSRAAREVLFSGCPSVTTTTISAVTADSVTEPVRGSEPCRLGWQCPQGWCQSHSRAARCAPAVRSCSVPAELSSGGFLHWARPAPPGALDWPAGLCSARGQMEKIVLALIPWKFPCAWESGSQALALPGAEVRDTEVCRVFRD